MRDEFDDGDDVSLVRPYSRTGGRTRTTIDLALETLVSVSGRGRRSVVDPEHQPVVDLCTQARSVAEIAALLAVPLGVARILVADLAQEGLLSVHDTATPQTDGAPSVELMERVLAGLHRL
jgi:uncharacterized protein DUF742